MLGGAVMAGGFLLGAVAGALTTPLRATRTAEAPPAAAMPAPPFFGTDGFPGPPPGAVDPAGLGGFPPTGAFPGPLPPPPAGGPLGP